MLSHFSLSNRNLQDCKSKMYVCVCACSNTMLSGHTVKKKIFNEKNGRQQFPEEHVQILTVTPVVKSVRVCVCEGESRVACGCVRGVLDTLKI